MVVHVIRSCVLWFAKSWPQLSMPGWTRVDSASMRPRRRWGGATPCGVPCRTSFGCKLPCARRRRAVVLHQGGDLGPSQPGAERQRHDRGVAPAVAASGVSLSPSTEEEGVDRLGVGLPSCRAANRRISPSISKGACRGICRVHARRRPGTRKPQPARGDPPRLPSPDDSRRQLSQGLPVLGEHHCGGRCAPAREFGRQSDAPGVGGHPALDAGGLCSGREPAPDGGGPQPAT